MAAYIHSMIVYHYEITDINMARLDMIDMVNLTVSYENSRAVLIIVVTASDSCCSTGTLCCLLHNTLEERAVLLISVTNERLPERKGVGEETSQRPRARFDTQD